MGGKTFNTILRCGCMMADDTGTPDEPNGDAGLIPCYAEYGDMDNPKHRAAFNLHEASWKVYDEERAKTEAPLSTIDDNIRKELNKSVEAIEAARTLMPQGTKNRTILRATKKIIYAVKDNLREPTNKVDKKGLTNSRELNIFNNGGRWGNNITVSTIQRYINNNLRNKGFSSSEILYRLDRQLSRMIYTYGTERPK